MLKSLTSSSELDLAGGRASMHLQGDVKQMCRKTVGDRKWHR